MRYLHRHFAPALLGYPLLAITCCCLLTFELRSQPATGGSLPIPDKAYQLPKDSPLRLVSIQPDPVYKDMLGVRTNGWLGSDDGDSMVLSGNKTLWLFGD